MLCAAAASTFPARPVAPAVDAHTHIAPTEHARAARHFDAAGVDWAVNLSGGWPGGPLEAQLEAARAEGRVSTAVSLPWRFSSHPRFVPVAVELLEAATRLGVRALKIEKALGLSARDLDGERLPVDSRRLDPIWAAAGRLGLPVMIHTGDPAAFWEPVTPDNERFRELSVHPGWSNHGVPGLPSFEALLSELERVVARHPGTVFVSVHFGNHAEDPAAVAAQLDRYPNLRVDLAARIVELGRRDPSGLRALFVRHAGRILLGTDLGLWPRGGVMLGSTGDTPDTDDEVPGYYRAHWAWLETSARIPSPVPIQGDWRITGIALDVATARRIERDNAEALFGPPPWRARAAARHPPFFRMVDRR